MDYFFLGDGGKQRKVSDADIPTGVIATDTSTGAIWATMVPAKGLAAGAYAALSFNMWIKELGHLRITLQTDGEPAILEFAEGIAARAAQLERMAKINLQHSPVESHGSNGAAERSIQTIRGLAKVFLSVLGDRSGAPLSNRSPWWSWAIRHATWIYNRFHKKAANAGLTAYEKYKAKKYQRPILAFGEAVWARRPGAALNKAAAPLHSGLWLGKDSLTDEHIIATGAGIFRTRTVKRKPHDAAWDRVAITNMRWTPWETGVTTRGRPPRTTLEQEPIVPAPLPSAAADHEFKATHCFGPEPAAPVTQPEAAPQQQQGGMPASSSGSPDPTVSTPARREERDASSERASKSARVKAPDLDIELAKVFESPKVVNERAEATSQERVPKQARFETIPPEAVPTRLPGTPITQRDPRGFAATQAPQPLPISSPKRAGSEPRPETTSKKAKPEISPITRQEVNALT